MKRIVALAIGCFLSTSLIAAVHAAPVASEHPKHQQGVKNGKKAMQAKRELDKKVREANKQGRLRRHQAQTE